ncbi:MAG TPA: hypothetical protein VFE28_10795 [Candidatus Krumholzibacteria bacterium]|nr:hypothetical protein [Candidatus Krumholzibacteria bacterium]
MIEMTWSEIVRALFIPREKKRKGPDPDPRVDVLVRMVFDLQMEVEALRAAQLASNIGAAGSPDSAYGRAYRDTAYLTHDSSGPSSGLDKLLRLFYPSKASEELGFSGSPRTWRECLMLHRLGFSEGQVRTWKQEAMDAELFT